ncbi:hypothetical protein SAMN05421504_105674 [Amycolatopsis xylanica]|uniref:Uncharacterized protein n=1 Tax=Amycolatopsis xylanica TaxID=589385 RepID=A0A1H3K6G9_9PSEU|nr:hypothetical protein [Amycolatopsis xylanica]SDY47800.1 hypothetical protein SAMN05421504_105674 [Amycolatopsis xylanica]
MEEQFTKGHLVTLMISSLIATGFGAGWWFSGTAAVNGPKTVLVVLGIVVVVALVAWIVALGRRGADLPAGGGRGDSPFGKQYGISVLLMVVGIFAGARVLSGVFDLPQAVPAWVLLLVGLHFLPFSRLFGTRRFLVLAILLCVVAVAAAVLGAAGQEWAWRTVPGFGGAVVLWGTAVAGLRSR